MRLPVALGAVPVGLRVRFRRGRAPGFALLIGGGLRPRRCAYTVSCVLVCASALAVAAAASRSRRLQDSAEDPEIIAFGGGGGGIGGGPYTVLRAAAAAFSAAGLCRSSVRLISGSAAAEALAACAGLDFFKTCHVALC